MKTIALVPGSYKPYHAGHDQLIRIAAKENDEVHLFVSTSDRIKKGEFPLYGEAMKTVWAQFIEPSLPPNVIVTYGGSPVTNVYKDLEEAEASGSTDKYTIYSDSEDILKFEDKKLYKSAPRMMENGQIVTRGITRGEETPDISGTKMREMLAAGNTKQFAKFLPPAIQGNAPEIIDILRRDHLGESLLREYVRLLKRHKILK